MKEYMSACEMTKQSLTESFWKTGKTQQLMKQSNKSANFKRLSHICYCFKLKAHIFQGICSFVGFNQVAPYNIFFLYT